MLPKPKNKIKFKHLVKNPKDKILKMIAILIFANPNTKTVETNLLYNWDSIITESFQLGSLLSFLHMMN